MKKFFLTLVTLFAFGFTMSLSAQDMQELPFDTAVVKGTLPNGLTYYIQHNENPKQRAFFYIPQKVGSVQEDDNQRGLAHFLEHMCFNGSEHFKGNGIVSFCQRIGVRFGAHLNAYTAADRTVYNIDNVPTTDPTNLDSCLYILYDWANGLTLDPAEIDKERGVIH
jgi:zinc protease